MDLILKEESCFQNGWMNKSHFSGSHTGTVPGLAIVEHIQILQAEDMDMEMEKERRRQALTLFIYLLSQDIQKEQKTVAGLARLSECYRNQPDYADYETVEDTNIKLRQVRVIKTRSLLPFQSRFF